MRLSDVARDAQTEPRTAGIAVARGFYAVERFEHALELIGWYSRSFVSNADNESHSVLYDDLRASTKLDRIRDEVRETAFQRLRLTRKRLPCFTLDGHV